MKLTLTPVERELFADLARRLAKGESPEQIAMGIDYPTSYVEQLLLRADFEEFFRTSKPSEFDSWQKARESDDADLVVKHLARSYAVHNFKKLQALVDSGALKPPEEATARANLLKMSGTIGEEVKVETVKISSAHMAALLEAGRETAN